MKVVVEKKHIRKGKQGDPDSCAVALALREKYHTASVAVKTATVQGVRFRLPKKATKFIQQFDGCKSKAKPITFRMKREAIKMRRTNEI